MWRVWLLSVLLYKLILADNNLALLSGTLKTYQRAACDDHMVTLNCPRGTGISVEVAQYGKSASNLAALCHDPNSPLLPTTNITCLWPNALQYSLLQTVVEACQKKQHCKFKSSPKSFGGDPCPGVRKYVEVAYKCRPYEFRSKVACENEVLHFTCNPNYRVAIFSAAFGRTEYESISCPQPQRGPEETCLASFATETVMQICHGKRNCSISADKATFGNPCKYQSTRMYLRVVFTCVPRTILREQFGETTEQDETPEPDEYMDNIDTVEDALRERRLFSPKQSLPGKSQNSSQSDVSITQPPIKQNEENILPENKEKLILYWALSISGGLVSVLFIVIGRLLWQRHKRSSNIANTTLPSFMDDLSEIDNDIDLTSPATITILPSSLPPGEVVRYGDASAPRSLSRSGNNQYYYG